MSDGELKETTADEYRATPDESPYAVLAEQLYRERVIRARMTPPKFKFLAGEELFKWACSITLAGIGDQFPDADEDERRRILEQRLALRERMERPS
jgi:hypothetical protein